MLICVRVGCEFTMKRKLQIDSKPVAENDVNCRSTVDFNRRYGTDIVQFCLKYRSRRWSVDSIMQVYVKRGVSNNCSIFEYIFKYLFLQAN